MAFLAVVIAFLATAASAEEKVSEYDRFRLWHECGLMGLHIENLDKDATDIGLTKDAITVAARSRLRSARLFQAGESRPTLVVRVSLFGQAFSIMVEYVKPVYDFASGVSAGAVVWFDGSIGTHGGDAPYILSSVSMHVDRFIDEYLRVNESAC